MLKEDSLIEAIKNNKNLPELIRNHIAVFVGSLRESYPEFDYDEFEKILSSIKFEEGVVEGYAKYNKDTNVLILDSKDALRDGIDLQHMVFCLLLSICTGKEVD